MEIMLWKHENLFNNITSGVMNTRRSEYGKKKETFQKRNPGWGALGPKL